MGREQALRVRPQTGWLLCVVCACVVLLQWSSVASGAGWITQPVSGPALVADGDLVSVSCVPRARCVAVGYFVSPSGVDRPLIEIRRGQRWSIQASAVPPGAGDVQLNAVVCRVKLGCIAVGFSVLASGATVPLAERWNGSSWSIQQTVDPSRAGGQLSALSCASARLCMAVGFGPRGTLIERWNGSRWSLQGAASLEAGSAGRLEGVSCAGRATCVAVGSAGRGAVAEIWNGRRWSRVSGPRAVGVLTAISCTSPQACSAISETDAIYAVQRWNGRRWTLENVPAHAVPRQACDPGGAECSNILTSITCVSASACYLAGALDVAAPGSSGQDTTAPIAAAWHGSRWQSEPVRDIGVCPTNTSVVCGTSLTGISCTAQSACVAVGAYGNAASVGQPLIEHRDLGRWSVQGAPSPAGPASSQLNAVSCSSSTACTAVGSYTTASGTSLPLAERWNGATWTIQPAPATGEFNGVSCPSATGCTAVGGEGPTAAGTDVLLAETWNGTTWTTMQTPGAGTFTAVSCASTAACMAVGPAGLTESWNGATWTIQPSASDDSLAAVSCVSSEACVAAGRDQTDGVVAESWNGTSWTAAPLPQVQLNALAPWSTAVSCSAANACTVVATNELITSQFQSSEEGLVFRWDGAAWSTQSIQLPAGEDVSTIGGVDCPTANSCTVVGSYTFFESDSPELTAPLLAHWDGAGWSAQQAPSDSGAPVLNGVSCLSTTTCVAVGERTITIPNGSPNSGLQQTIPYILSSS
jgi:hypothetical protein